jgi:hypothetical protein
LVCLSDACQSIKKLACELIKIADMFIIPYVLRQRNTSGVTEN